MIYIINIALFITLIGIALSQLKAERRITQKHFDGDLRQKIFIFFKKMEDAEAGRLSYVNLFFYIFSLHLISLLLVRFLYLIYDENDQYLFNTNLFLQSLLGPDLIIRDSSGAITNNLFEISVVIAFNLAILGIASYCISCISYIIFCYIITFFINIIYYNPQHKYCLVRSKSSGKYTIFKIDIHNLPNPDYILQHLGKHNNSEFNSKQDVLNAISKLKNKDNIISNLLDKN